MPSNPTGRPSSFTDELGLTICARLSEGQSLVEICRDDTMPNPATVYRWIKQSDAFREQYTQAREMQADYLGDQILDIADDARNDWMDRSQGDEGSVRVVDHEHIARSKVRIDARKWLMAKMAPKKYGDRVTNHMVGKDDDSPIEANVVTHSQRARAMALLLAKTEAQSDG